MSGFATGWHEDEQAMEAEALEAILMDDVEIVSASSPREFHVQCVPHPNGDGENHGKPFFSTFGIASEASKG